MKPLLPSILCLGASALLMASTSLKAQSWETVVSDVPGTSGDIGTDASGQSVYSVGRLIDDTTGNSEAVVLELDRPTGNWVTLDAYAEPGLNYAYNRAFAADPVTGRLFAGGNLNHLLPGGTYEFDALWFIRERDPQTGVWRTADDHQALIDDGLGQSSCADILVTPSGDVYATGGGQSGWLVRKRRAGSTAFTTVDVSPGSGWHMNVHPAHGVFVVGEANGLWTVRRSASGEPLSWRTVDTFTVRRQWGGGKANHVLVARNGAIYVAGRAFNQTTGRNHWVVRRSTDGGVTWSIVDDMPPTQGNAEAVAIAEDASGRIVVCGLTGDAANSVMSWMVRRGQLVEKTSRQKGKTVTTWVWEWTYLDPGYQLAPGRDSRANAITIDARGDIHVSGRGDDADGVRRFIVRRLPATP